MHFSLPPTRRPRHPLVRALSLLIGLALVAVLMVFGLFVVGVLLVGGALLLALRQWKHGRVGSTRASFGAPTHGAREAKVLEGEFVVIHQDRTLSH